MIIQCCCSVIFLPAFGNHKHVPEGREGRKLCRENYTAVYSTSKKKNGDELSRHFKLYIDDLSRHNQLELWSQIFKCWPNEGRKQLYSQGIKLFCLSAYSIFRESPTRKNIASLLLKETSKIL